MIQVIFAYLMPSQPAHGTGFHLDGEYAGYIGQKPTATISTTSIVRFGTASAFGRLAAMSWSPEPPMGSAKFSARLQQERQEEACKAELTELSDKTF